jgi:predicted nucleic acid-binding protein
MVVYQLRAQDAFQVATALETGVLDFATRDDHFGRVGQLNRWLMRDESVPGHTPR